MCPICFLISCRIFLCLLTLSNTSSFLTWSVQLIFSILLQHYISKLSSYFWSAARSVQVSAPYKAMLRTLRVRKCSPEGPRRSGQLGFRITSFRISGVLLYIQFHTTQNKDIFINFMKWSLYVTNYEIRRRSENLRLCISDTFNFKKSK